MDYREELERLDNQIFHAREAIENLECVDDSDEIIEIVRDRLRELTGEYNRVHASVEASEDAEYERLRRDYWLEAM